MITHQQSKSDEKKWYERVAQFASDHGCFPHCNLCNYDMHHVMGRKARHNKVAVGAWFVLPIQKEYHDVHSNNPFNVTHFRKRYQIEFGNQRDQFLAMCMTIKSEDGGLIVPDEVLQSIMTTRY